MYSGVPHTCVMERRLKKGRREGVSSMKLFVYTHVKCRFKVSTEKLSPEDEHENSLVYKFGTILLTLSHEANQIVLVLSEIHCWEYKDERSCLHLYRHEYSEMCRFVGWMSNLKLQTVHSNLCGAFSNNWELVSVWRRDRWVSFKCHLLMLKPPKMTFE